MKHRVAISLSIVALLVAMLITTFAVNLTSTQAASSPAVAVSENISIQAAPTKKLPNINSFPKKIEGYAKYVGQKKCSPKEKPGVVAFKNMFLKAFPNTGSFPIGRKCNVGGQSEHKEGRAWDWKANAKNAGQRKSVNEGLAWLFATDKYGHKHAMIRRTGVMYIIWNGKVWSAYKASKGWQKYTGSNPHTDHVHISFSWDGANKKTSFWTSK